jgi:predicted Holliday junction resolvase-like endonuclease
VKQKIIAFCLKHWKEIGLILLLLVVFGKSQYDMRNIIKAHEVSQNSLKTQLQQLQGIHADELQQRDEALEKYKQRNEELEEKYQDALTDLSIEIDKRKKNVIRRYRDDKESLIKQIEDTYGLTYVP